MMTKSIVYTILTLLLNIVGFVIYVTVFSPMNLLSPLLVPIPFSSFCIFLSRYFLKRRSSLLELKYGLTNSAIHKKQEKEGKTAYTNNILTQQQRGYILKSILVGHISFILLYIIMWIYVLYTFRQANSLNSSF